MQPWGLVLISKAAALMSNMIANHILFSALFAAGLTRVNADDAPRATMPDKILYLYGGDQYVITFFLHPIILSRMPSNARCSL